VLAAEVARAMGATADLRHLPARNEVMHAYASHEKASRVFQYHAQTSLTAGLARMAAWARAAGSRESQPFRGIEIERGLPSAWREAADA